MKEIIKEIGEWYFSSFSAMGSPIQRKQEIKVVN